MSTWWIKYTVDGRPKCESSKSKKLEKAKSLLKLREGDIERGVPILPKLGLVRFDEAAKDVLDDFRMNGYATLLDATARIELHLKPVFGGRVLAKITPSEIAAYASARRKEGARNGTINRELATLKRMFNLARERKKLLHDHIPEITMLQENNVRQGFFEHHEYLSVLKHLPAAVRPAVTFAYVTGWRINSEVLPLQWRQVDLKAGEIRLDAGSTKNGDGRVIYFSPELRTVFEEQWAEHEALKKKGKIVPDVFHRNGRPIKSIRIAWQNACKAAKVPGRIPHDLRRTAVRNMVRAGIPERVAMQVSGHKTRSVFERYNVVSDGDLREAARRLSSYTFGYTQPVAVGQGSKNSQNS